MIGSSKRVAKIVITAFKDRELAIRVCDFVAEFNPQTLSISQAVEYDESRILGHEKLESRFAGLASDQLSFELPFSAPQGSTDGIEKSIIALRATCGGVDENSREPHFLKMQWGQMLWDGQGYFVGRMRQLDVRYTRFSPDGAPLAATAHLSIGADRGQLFRGPRNTSTNSRAFPMPIGLTETAAYFGGTVALYLELARLNGLDHLQTPTPAELTLPADWS